MKYGMKTFDIIEQVSLLIFHHEVLIRIWFDKSLDDLGIEVKQGREGNIKDAHFTSMISLMAMSPEAIRAARVLIHDVSNQQYDASINRGLGISSLGSE